MNSHVCHNPLSKKTVTWRMSRNSIRFFVFREGGTVREHNARCYHIYTRSYRRTIGSMKVMALHNAIISECVVINDINLSIYCVYVYNFTMRCCACCMLYSILIQLLATKFYYYYFSLFVYKLDNLQQTKI